MNSLSNSIRLTVILGCALGASPSFGAAPPNNDTSDSDGNTAGGTSALVTLTTGKLNTAFGKAVLQDNTTGDNNTAFGNVALLNNSEGDENTAIGQAALLVSTTGNGNTAAGVRALENNTTGSENTSVGLEALSQNSDSSGSTALGFKALANSGGLGNIGIGKKAGFNLGSGDNNIYIDNSGKGTESGTIRIGKGVHTATFIAGISGTPISGSTVLINSKGRLGILASSARYKRDIRDMGEGSQGLLDLRPVTFRYKGDSSGERQYGLVAEEVAKVYPELVVRTATGEVQSVKYEELIPMLLNEVQHQRQVLGAQAQQLAEQRERDEALLARMARLEESAAHGTTLASR